MNKTAASVTQSDN